jgi:hypothetical protein
MPSELYTYDLRSYEKARYSLHLTTFQTCTDNSDYRDGEASQDLVPGFVLYTHLHSDCRASEMRCTILGAEVDERQSGKRVENVYTDTFLLQGATRWHQNVPSSIFNRRTPGTCCCGRAKNLSRRDFPRVKLQDHDWKDTRASASILCMAHGNHERNEAPS